MQILYFAWLRERVGIPKEQIETSAKTVSELVEELKLREDRYALAFSDMSAVKVALDQEVVGLDASLNNVREIAFFPPMTGG